VEGLDGLLAAAEGSDDPKPFRYILGSSGAFTDPLYQR
jgi:hypothetical protein